MKKIFLFILINFLISNQSFAANQITQWQIVPFQSKIEFAANKDNAPVNGSFNKFAGMIAFDKTNLSNSQILINVDLNSLSTSFYGADEKLRSKEWLDLKSFPVAQFKSEKFSQINKDQFHCDGFLQLKGIKLPVGLDFSFQEYSSNKAHANGVAKISRSNFGIGNKDEKLADGVKDLVEIKFTIVAVVK
ncbi:MAG: YceI family protein [Pseudomonadota bacterium]